MWRTAPCRPRATSSGGATPRSSSPPPSPTRPRTPRPLPRRPGALLPLPGYPQVRVALPSRRVAAAIAAHRADLVHLAGPFVLGVRGMTAAARLGIPAVAVYQTDLAGYARTYVGTGEGAAWRRLRAVHGAADRTLAPPPPPCATWRPTASAASGAGAEAWTPSASAPRCATPPSAANSPPTGAPCRLRGPPRPEKRVDLLAGVCALPGVRVVVVGDGPSRPALRAALPGARFLGRRTGADLARIFASLDVFAHTGPYETFCQTVQEAMASGVPVVAPAAGGPWTWSTTGAPGSSCPGRPGRAARGRRRARRRTGHARRLRAGGRTAVEDAPGRRSATN
ncbi:glycosyltransferase [Streptomyces diastatochromogenes]|nr:glycosyltransferase [Streptomyces diastatochromogenes]